MRYVLKCKNTGLFVQSYNRFSVTYTRVQANAMVEAAADILLDAKAISALFNADLVAVAVDVK